MWRYSEEKEIWVLGGRIENGKWLPPPEGCWQIKRFGDQFQAAFFTGPGLYKQDKYFKSLKHAKTYCEN